MLRRHVGRNRCPGSPRTARADPPILLPERLALAWLDRLPGAASTRPDAPRSWVSRVQPVGLPGSSASRSSPASSGSIPPAFTRPTRARRPRHFPLAHPCSFPPDLLKVQFRGHFYRVNRGHYHRGSTAIELSSYRAHLSSATVGRVGPQVSEDGITGHRSAAETRDALASTNRIALLPENILPPDKISEPNFPNR